MSAKIAFLGLGVMGFPMAGHLSKNGYDLNIYNRTIIKSENWIKKYQGNLCKTPAEAIVNADYIITCVGEDKDLLEIFEGSNGIFKNIKSGSIVIDHTTASAKIAKNLYKKCKSINVGFLDAPVSGGQVGAENGKLSIMVGGDLDVYTSVNKILISYGKTIELIGPSGSGQISKMINQICIAGLVQGLSEALAFGKKSNINMDRVLKVISKGAAQSWQMDNRSETMLKNEFDFGFAVDWMKKDLKICFDHADEIDAKLPITNIIYDFYENVRKNGGNRWDTSSLISLLE